MTATALCAMRSADCIADSVLSPFDAVQRSCAPFARINAINFGGCLPRHGAEAFFRFMGRLANLGSRDFMCNLDGLRTSDGILLTRQSARPFCRASVKLFVRSLFLRAGCCTATPAPHRVHCHAFSLGVASPPPCGNTPPSCGAGSHTGLTAPWAFRGAAGNSVVNTFLLLASLICRPPRLKAYLTLESHNESSHFCFNRCYHFCFDAVYRYRWRRRRVVLNNAVVMPIFCRWVMGCGAATAFLMS